MGSIRNEKSAAKILGITHRQLVRWRKEQVKGRNPPYYYIDGAYRYDVELLVFWKARTDEAKLEAIRSKKLDKGSLLRRKKEPEPLLEGLQPTPIMSPEEWMVGLSDEQIEKIAYGAQDKLYGG